MTGATFTDPPPWPWITVQQAARKLNVSTRYIDGLRNHNQKLRTVTRQSTAGDWFVCYCQSDVENLAEQVRQP